MIALQISHAVENSPNEIFVRQVAVLPQCGFMTARPAGSTAFRLRVAKQACRDSHHDRISVLSRSDNELERLHEAVLGPELAQWVARHAAYWIVQERIAETLKLPFHIGGGE